MAFRRRLGNLAGTLLETRLRRREAEHQSELVKQRQMELEGINTEQQLLGRVLADPALAARLRASGRQQVARQDITPFIPDATDAAGKLGGEVSGVSDLSKLQTDEDIHTGFHGATFSAHDDNEGEIPEIQRLIAQRNARRAAIESSMIGQAVKDIGPDGTERTRHVLPHQLDELGALQTERTGVQEGERESANYFASEGSKAWGDNAITRANEMESGTRGERVRTAGAISGAQAGATNAADTAQLNDPRYQAGRAAVVTAEEKAKATLAAQLAAEDPNITKLAEAIIRDPGLLQDRSAMPPTVKAKVLAVLSGDPRFKTARQGAAQRVLDTAWGALTRVESNEGGLEGATGFRVFDPSRWTWSGEPVQGSEAADFATDFDQLKAALTLPNLEFLRGLGHMSDREFAE
jgi:hypothetical protein